MSQIHSSPSTPSAILPSVSLHQGRPATTSLDVAKFFGKRHDNVMRSVKDLMDNCPNDFTALNFEVSEYPDETGRSLPMFTLYRDGFMLLVMGYTGRKALAVKLAYIEAFNRMEAALAAYPARNIAGDIVPAPRGADALARVADVEALSGGMLRLHLESARGAWTCPMSAAAVAARDIRRGDTLRFASSGRLLGVDLTRRPADALPPDLTEPAVPALTGVEQAWLRCIAADSEVICEEFGLIRERLRRQDGYIQALEVQLDELRQRPDPRLNQIFGDMWDMKMRLAALLRERGLAGAPSLPPAAPDAGGISGPACGRVKRFLEQRCRRSEGARAAAGALYAAFVRWHGEGADGVPSKKTFGVCLGVCAAACAPTEAGMRASPC